MAEVIRKLVVKIGGKWFLERDPFDIGSGGCYYTEPSMPSFNSVEEAIEHAFANLISDLDRAVAQG